MTAKGPSWRWAAAALLPLVLGCARVPPGLAPVKGFELDRYLGTWYEIVRLDHWFERGLTDVSATYARRPDGGISVVNRGYDPVARRWREVTGRGYQRGEPDAGALRVTFFWPFYGGYNVLALERENYDWALVCGPSRSYLWILARRRRLDEAVVAELLERALALGFSLEELEFVEHGPAAGDRP